jgi:hypothetical protein
MACSNRIVDQIQNEGSTIVCEFKLTDGDDNQLSADGITFTFTGKLDADDTDGNAAWQVVTVGNGLDEITCSASSTGLALGTYRYDIIGEQGGDREVYENLSIVLNQTVAD